MECYLDTSCYGGGIDDSVDCRNYRTQGDWNRNHKDAYEHLLKITPKVGAIVDTKQGKGEVVDMNLLTGKLTVRLEKNPEAAPQIFNRKEVKLIKDARITIAKEELEALKGIEGE